MIVALLILTGTFEQKLRAGMIAGLLVVVCMRAHRSGKLTSLFDH